MIVRPPGNTHSSTWGLMLIFWIPSVACRPAMSISLSKWPMLPTIAWCFMAAMCCAEMTSLLPVVVTKMSTWPTTSCSVATW